ncbi:MAG: serine hydrolase [Gemmatimonadaceae bacterium]
MRSLLTVRLLAVLVVSACRTAPMVATAAGAYPHEQEPIGTVRESYDGRLSDTLAVHTFRNIHRLFPTRMVAPAAVPRALYAAPQPLTRVALTAGDTTDLLARYIAANRVTGLLVLDRGRVAYEFYGQGNGPQTRWMSMSMAKSITATLVGAALRDGAIHSLQDPVTQYVPALIGSAYDGVSIRELLMMASGVRWTERYTDPTSDRRRLLEAQIAQQPGGLLAVMRALPRAAPPGTVHTYSTGETQVLAEVLHGAIQRPLADYLSEKIWRPAGMEAPAVWWLASPNGLEIGGSGLSATLRDYGRLGLFLLDQGIVGRDTLLPPGWMAEATSPQMLRNGTAIDYGYMWWTATTAEARRDHAYTAQGIHGQFLYVNPAAQVVVVVWSAQPQPTGGDVVNDLAVFDAVVRALRLPSATSR